MKINRPLHKTGEKNLHHLSRYQRDFLDNLLKWLENKTLPATFFKKNNENNIPWHNWNLFVSLIYYLQVWWLVYY